MLLLNNHLKGDYIDCHIGTSQGDLNLVEIITTEIQRVPADVVFVLEGIWILLRRRLALDSEIIDFYGVTIETNGESESNQKDDLSMLVIFQYSHGYTEIEN